MFDVIVVGAGACGIMSAISSARIGKSVLLLEKLPKIGAKLKATGGGRCNLTNTLKQEDFISAFGKNGRFMRDVLSEGDGYRFAKEFGHSITELSPAMMPLKTKEKWVANCRADTIAKAQISIALPKYKKLKATGDLIFTKDGIRGPVVLDFAREITPLLDKFDEVPLHVNLLEGKGEDEILLHIKKHSDKTIEEAISLLLANSVTNEILKICKIDKNRKFKEIEGKKRDNLIKTLAKTPLHIIGHEGFEKAMITRGGVSLKEIEPKTMQSKLINGLYFCGEVVDLDGKCGGYNLQWSFSSGYVAGLLKG